METKTFSKFIVGPDTEPESLVQGYAPTSLRARVVAKMKSERDAGKKVNWNVLVKAMCLAYLAED